MIYIFDIDGTLADITHRLHFIQQEPKDWDSFFDACVDDKLIDDVFVLMRDLCSVGHFIVLSSGRSDRVREKTEGWLARHCAVYNALYMRRDGDHREDYEVKSKLLDQIIVAYPYNRIGGVFEDRQQVVDMYRARGLRVYQVAKGDF